MDTVITSLSSTCAGPFVTLEDGIPRALCHPDTTITITSTTKKTVYHEKSVGTFTEWMEKRPACSVSMDGWLAVWDDWFSNKTSRFLAATSSKKWDIDPEWEYGGLKEQLLYNGYPGQCLRKNGSCGCWGSCVFSPWKVQLLYWPLGGEETIPKRENHSPTKTEHETSATAVWSGLRLTSPTPYVYFSTMINRLGDCGKTHTQVLAPLEDKDIWSAYADKGFGTSRSLNWQDMEYKTVSGIGSYPLVPHSSYLQQSKCKTQKCDTIYPDYQPIIKFKIPNSVFTSIDPDWKVCGYEWYNHYDPPIVLSAVENLAVPTLAPIPAPPDLSVRPGEVVEGSFPIETGIPKSSETSSPTNSAQGKNGPKGNAGHNFRRWTNHALILWLSFGLVLI
jgi:hypothetical protein